MEIQKQLADIIILSGEQEKKIELLQLTQPFPDKWKLQANIWCQIALQKIQQNAVHADGLLESLLAEENELPTTAPDPLEIPSTPVEYEKLILLERYKDALDSGTVYGLIEIMFYADDSKLIDLFLFDIEEINWTNFFHNAIFRGRVEIVRRLIQDKLVDPSVDNNYAILSASEFGRIDIVELLLQDCRVDPSVNNNDPIRSASKYGYLAVVDRLLKDPPSWHPYRGSVDPSDGDNEAIINASGGGRLDVVERLLQDPRVDPSYDNNKAIRYARRCEHMDVVARLKQDPRVIQTILNNSIE